MYSFPSRIRYSETDYDGKLKLISLLNLFQDCTSFHSEDIGLGIKYHSDQQIGWVLNAWQIDIERYPKFGETVEIGTFPYDFKKFMGYRNFFLLDQNHHEIAKANSVWTLVDLKTGRPIVPNEDILKGYRLHPKLSMEYLDRKIVIPCEDHETYDAIEVMEYHLDTNHHVNNGQYVKLAHDLSDHSKEIIRMRAEYNKSAKLGDHLVPKLFRGNRCDFFVFENKDGVKYATVYLEYLDN